ncbi:MAG: carbohydrate ABC transporter permease [Candidatus Zhuqueibacterota bacterium]
MKKYFSGIICSLYFVFILFPFLWGLRTSLAGRFDNDLIPSRLTLEHYKALLCRSEFFDYFGNSLVVSLCSIGITVLVALLGGYALARLQFRGSKLGFLLLILPLLPPVAILVPLISYFQELSLYNTRIAVIIANVVFSIPLSVWMMRNFILGTPVEIEEAARIDGCTRLGTLFHIVLPALGPGIVAVAVFVFINSWNNYLYAFALTSSQSLRVLPQGILSFLGSWGTYWGGLTASGILVMIPPVLLFLIFQKWFIAGIFGQQLK